MDEPSAARRYDVVVIGAGPTGENVAQYAVQGGLSAVIVESELIGGECSYWACMPSKALLRPPAALAAAREVAGSREAVTGGLDVAAVLARRDGFTSGWDDEGQASWLADTGIDLVRGRGRLTGEKTVSVRQGDDTAVTLAAEHAVVICTGSDAAVPPIPGLREARPWTSREVTSAKDVPGRLVVVGGGVVGCEMTDAFDALGSAVTMVVRGDRLLPGVEPFAGDLVADALRERGVDIRLGASAEHVERRPDGTVVVATDTGAVVAADEVLVAAGRRPRTEDIGLGAVGLTDGAWLDVDDTCLVRGVAGEWLYAAGDLNHRALLTHMGKYQARACGAAIAARARGRQVGDRPWSRYVATADHLAVPQVVFTRPEVAAVGLSYRQAQDAGMDARAVDFPIGSVAGASLHADGYTGQARVVVDERRHVVVGATFAGPDVADLLHAATVAVVGEVPIERLWHAVPAYPTISEVWLRLLETYST
ncbi:MAG: NAD(P)/FAD-dependent oxidoreductase [Streptosporangiales bacterium]|nr:NAD(P)/FAD-dependent oxidoreductase [Streptosporangiales bacterium]MBO0891455.1 NAD(P)/FAD-dependent oxidoreductase [Acidothermales bacterium]